MRPNSDFQKRLVSGFRGTEVVIYAVPAGEWHPAPTLSFAMNAQTYRNYTA
jgi:hypothetical protein